MKQKPKYMVVQWPSGWSLYRVLKRKHGNPPANDLTEIASDTLGNLEVKAKR
jgi:hypothetical protein